MDNSRALSLFWKSHLLSTLICLSISDNLHPFLLPWFGLSFNPSSNLLIAFSRLLSPISFKSFYHQIISVRLPLLLNMAYTFHCICLSQRVLIDPSLIKYVSYYQCLRSQVQTLYLVNNGNSIWINFPHPFKNHWNMLELFQLWFAEQLYFSVKYFTFHGIWNLMLF